MQSTSRLKEHLLADHRRLEDRFERLLAAFEANDREDLQALWSEFDGALLRHMSLEEQHLLPLLRRVNPIAVRAIEAEHAHLRARLTELGAGLDLHILRLETARAFIDELRAHAKHEDEVLYGWADEHVDDSTRALVLRALADAVIARVHAPV